MMRGRERRTCSTRCDEVARWVLGFLFDGDDAIILHGGATEEGEEDEVTSQPEGEFARSTAMGLRLTP
jgi:hypothetical protein